jgi:UDP-2,3-diacylglucosamine pyrophosphatase LpxH
MHVGRDCKEITGFMRPRRPNPEFDRAFIDFLDFYVQGREHEWRLILAGDFVDFMEVVVVPGAQGFLNLNVSFEVTAEERAFGLGSEAERVLVKLEKTLEYHAEFFERLARFVKLGGELVVVRGNHDVEFFWRKVEQVFRRHLADLAFRPERLDVDEAIERRNAFQERIRMEPWFYYEADRIYIEHGHQYDAYCSFDHWLHPVSPTDPRHIDTPVSAFAMRYFVNLMQDFTPQVGVWTYDDYLNWMRKNGLGGVIYAAKMAFGAAYRLVIYTLLWTFGSVRHYQKEHDKQLLDEARRFGIPPAKLAEIDDLHDVPVSRNLPELFRLLFLDRILLACAALFLVLMVLWMVDARWLELAAIALIGVGVVRVNRHLAPRRALEPGPRQHQAAARIAQILEVPLVVMGHSHGRRDADVGHQRRYVNTGCWLPPLPGRDHVEPSEPCTCTLSHLLVETDGRAELRVYCKAAKTVRLTDLSEASVAKAQAEREMLESPAHGLVP